jgi:hypothetical protein
MVSYLNKKTRTKVVKLNKLVPVELRYETIVVEDGKLHIHRDVYDQNTNTEENLRTVLEANDIGLDDLSAEERAQVLDGLNAMSRPKKPATPKPSSETVQNSTNPAVNANERKAEAERQKKLRNLKEIVIEISLLNGKGYPAPLNLGSGFGVKMD